MKYFHVHLFSARQTSTLVKLAVIMFTVPLMVHLIVTFSLLFFRCLLRNLVVLSVLTITVDLLTVEIQKINLH